MPTACQRTCFSLAVTDDACREQIGIIEHRPISVRQGVAELSAFMNGTGSLGSRVAGNAPRKRKLSKEFLQASLVLRNIRIQFGVRSFQIRLGDDGGSTVTRPSNENGIQVLVFDDPVQMHIKEIQS